MPGKSWGFGGGLFQRGGDMAWVVLDNIAKVMGPEYVDSFGQNEGQNEGDRPGPAPGYIQVILAY